MQSDFKSDSYRNVDFNRSPMKNVSMKNAKTEEHSHDDTHKDSGVDEIGAKYSGNISSTNDDEE